MWYMPGQEEAEHEDKVGRRQRLLEAAVDHAAGHGLSDLSLRQLAAALGTSHRMLIYHFGSKEGLLIAVINEMEQRQRTQMAALETNADLPVAEMIRGMWRHLSEPDMWPHERLFFEVYGQALQGREGTTQLLDGIVEDWLGPATAIGMQRGMSKADARAFSRLGLAVVRGLLLDLLATGDRKGCTAALEQFIALLPPEPLPRPT
jgi:AcrR family transcriptional regulator